MLYEHQRRMLAVLAIEAEENLKTNCPLIEDEVAIAAWQHIKELEDFVDMIACDETDDKYKAEARALQKRLNVRDE